MTEMQTKITEMRTEMTEMRAEMTEMRAEMTERFDKFQKTLQQMQRENLARSAAAPEKRPMSLAERRKAVGQLFAVGFHGTETNAEIKSLIQDYGVGAVVLFKRNVQAAAQLQSLCLGLQRLARDAGHTRPLFVGIDQENGLVSRISPPVAPQLPGPMTLGATASLDSAYRVAKATGNMLRYFGINMNYAPVGDVNSEPLNPVIGVRSPGDDAAGVAQFAVECARGLRETGVAPCIKHFPGHGDTAVDSHHGLPVIDKTREELEQVELVPFRRAAAEGIEMVMTAHISLPGLSGSRLPATLSPEVIDMLRRDLEFDGVIMTDCLEMDGVRAGYGTVEAALMALKAGVDNVMICHTYDVQTAAIDRVCDAVSSGDLSQARLDPSLERLRVLKDKYTDWDAALGAQPPSHLADLSSENEALAREIYANAATVVRSEARLLPLSRTASTLFVSPGLKVPTSGAAVSGEAGVGKTRVPWVSSSFGDILRRYNPDIADIRFTDAALTPEQWRQVEDAQVVILATRNARESQYQRDLGLRIAKRRAGKTLIGVATCSPYDFLDDEAEVKNFIAVYEPTPEAFASAADILYGEAAARGKLPISCLKKG
ncbi:Glycoside hydrolase, family 3 [Metarhizium album ARSEF 1941]|uniref:Glycoside hydrolase, family 3 n=1 Tax=Metarhizium album (strain ARSEF 1941) TaxID=1081103 RepID=A0A0B2WUS5_METAS|nr:Glycoside hydrolase, family 3 [Metarhizium album ARSEF 1941]KHN97369.1 Glycoside hydrolase, family 3 [Metarhizium album ARSEF 1941]